MSLFMGGKQIVGSGETPRIGTNGNWYIGANDTGVPSGATVHYTNAVQFKTQSEEGIYFVYEPPANMTIYHIDENGKKRIVGNKDVIVPVCGSNGNWFIGSTDTGIPVSGDGSKIAGAAIADENVNGSTVWSSAKVVKELNNVIKNSSGKALEFRWDGTRLGVRNDGDSEYIYSNLKGEKGDTGLNGASIVNAKMNDSGELILEVPDNFDNQDLTKLLTFESGVITLNDMKIITENISKLNNQVKELSNKVTELTERLEGLTNSSNNG